MSTSIGINTFKGVILEVWHSLNLPPVPELEVECFHIVDKDAIKVRAYSPYFKTVDDYIDEAWERNKY